MFLSRNLTLLASLVLSSSAVVAHPAWIMPSQSLFEKPSVVTVDGALSEDGSVFELNHRPLRFADGFYVLKPDGSSYSPKSEHYVSYTGRYRSSIEVPLAMEGSYRLGLSSYQIEVVEDKSQEKGHGGDEKGASDKGRGDKKEPAADKPASTLKPGDRVENISRIETFVSVGRVTTIRPLNQGIEMIPQTSLADLHAGQSSRFRFLMDGKPLADLKVTLIKDGTRYRKDEEAIHLQSDDKGDITVKWPHNGMYLLEARGSDTHGQYAQRNFRYVGSLEVLPQ